MTYEEQPLLITTVGTDSAIQRLTELNNWLPVNGQVKRCGVDVGALVAAT